MRESILDASNAVQVFCTSDKCSLNWSINSKLAREGLVPRTSLLVDIGLHDFFYLYPLLRQVLHIGPTDMLENAFHVAKISTTYSYPKLPIIWSARFEKPFNYPKALVCVQPTQKLVVISLWIYPMSPIRRRWPRLDAMNQCRFQALFSKSKYDTKVESNFPSQINL